MTKEMLPYFAIGLISVLVSAVSQVMLKKASMKPHGSTLAEYTDPIVIFAYFMFGASTLLTMFAYRKVPLSLSPMFDCCSYILVIIFGVTIFKERMNRKKYLAVVLLLAGLVAYSL